MDDTSVNFIELVALSRITAESTAERFGSLINSSFFDASNILATLKQKGLVDFVTAFPSQSTLKVTDGGVALLTEAGKKSAEPLDALDMAIMAQLSAGRRGLVDLNGSVNVTQKDLALHLFKLNAQQHISFELANANMNIYLTEKGFLAVKNVGQVVQQAGVPYQPTAPQPQVPAAAEQPPKLEPEELIVPGQVVPAAPVYTPPPTPEGETNVIDEIIKRNKAKKKRRNMTMMLLVGILVVLIIVMYVKGVI